MGEDKDIVGIVDEKVGGIIAYALSPAHADLIVRALRDGRDAAEDEADFGMSRFHWMDLDSYNLRDLKLAVDKQFAAEMERA